MEKAEQIVEMEKCGEIVDMDKKDFMHMLGLAQTRKRPDPKSFFEELREEQSKRHRELESFRHESSDSIVRSIAEMTEMEIIRRKKLLNIEKEVYKLCLVDKKLYNLECLMIHTDSCKEKFAQKRKAAEELKQAMQASKKRCMEECVRSATADSAPLKSAASPLVCGKPQRITKKNILDQILLDGSATNTSGVVLGPNGTTISKNALQGINWSLSDASITRKILVEVFDRETLASHTLSGKPSPAFIGSNKPLKGQLDPAKVADILYFLSKYFNMAPRQVRSAITTKCADENKMERQRQAKQGNVKQEGDDGRARHSY